MGLFENPVYGRIPECLNQLVDKADSIPVATSKPTVYSERIIEHFALSQYFNVIYGSNLDGSLADKTDLLGHIVKSEGILSQDTLMIGDRSYDMIGARNHGIKAIGVLWGYGTEEELNNAGANALCNHPSEIYAQIFI